MLRNPPSPIPSPAILLMPDLCPVEMLGDLLLSIFHVLWSLLGHSSSLPGSQYSADPEKCNETPKFEPPRSSARLCGHSLQLGRWPGPCLLLQEPRSAQRPGKPEPFPSPAWSSVWPPFVISMWCPPVCPLKTQGRAFGFPPHVLPSCSVECAWAFSLAISSIPSATALVQPRPVSPGLGK